MPNWPMNSLEWATSISQSARSAAWNCCRSWTGTVCTSCLGQPDPGVLDDQPGAAGPDGKSWLAHPGSSQPAGGDRVYRVLEQLPQVHAGAGIQVVREQVEMPCKSTWNVLVDAVLSITEGL